MLLNAPWCLSDCHFSHGVPSRPAAGLPGDKCVVRSRPLRHGSAAARRATIRYSSGVKGDSSVDAAQRQKAGTMDGDFNGASTSSGFSNDHQGLADEHAPLSSVELSMDEGQLRRRMKSVAASGAISTSSSDDDDSEHWQQHTASARAARAQNPTASGAELEATPEDGEKGFMGMSKSLEGMVLLNIGAALFGSNMVAIKAAEDSMSSTALSAMRFAIAAIAFTPWVVRGLRIPEVRKSSVELAFWLFGGYLLQAYGLEVTTAARGAFTSTFTVVAVPLLVGLSGRHVAWQTWASAVAALIGVGMLTNSGGDPTWGDAMCIGSAVLFGVHKWRSEAVTSQVPQTTELVAVQLAALAVASALFTVPEIWGNVQVENTSQLLSDFMALPWPALLFMGLGTTALTLAIEMNALKHVSSPTAAIIYTAEPLWGAGLAYVLLGERWGALGWVGAAIIIASSLAAQSASRDTHPVAGASIDGAKSD